MKSPSRPLWQGGWSTLWILAASLAPADTPQAPPSEAVAGYWFDGAEINRYELQQRCYGELHPGHAVLVFVTEPFLVEEQVKRDFGQGQAVSVLKMNAMRDFLTGLYPYRTMTSVFQPVDQKAALKVTTSVQEWCGHAFSQSNRRTNGLKTEVHSYFQRAERGQFTSPPDVLLEDELWTQLRLDPSALPTGSFEMVPGSLFLRLRHQDPAPHPAVGSWKESQQAGRSIYSLHYPDLGRSLEIEVETAFPYVIQAWEELEAGGKVFAQAQLTHRLEKQYYWSQNGLKDRSKRAKLGLPTE
ncbi:MAG: septum formation inhibitor Maf [Verrucomicrobiota bacterium]